MATKNVVDMACLRRVNRDDSSRYSTNGCMGSFGDRGGVVMAINDSGRWWTATEPSDIPIYLAEYTRFECAYPATEFRQVRCVCSSDRFRLVRAREMTERTCAN